MSNLFLEVAKGGPIMVPIVGLSVASLAIAFERSLFWYRISRGGNRIAAQILAAAREDLDKARAVAEDAQHMPVARFLLAPLQLEQPDPETFRLALEAAADREFVQMRRGDKLLETVVAMAPLFGLLGTVTGLTLTFFNLDAGGSGGSGGKANVDLSKAATGIAEALVTTAGGMVVALIALAVLRLCVTMQSRQMDAFSDMGSELELIYRQSWHQTKWAEVSSSNRPMPEDEKVVEQLATLIQQLTRQ
ncbi:MAG: MotA/TolQ/ExbB proton channel family protein [Leptolyngbyaceae cyanobacterium CSU_1_3]|nr:MotA/TolQ/ExbB proton channel family protein [Leptolyngbyaceae cyanobacterium CSU_1_3]